MIADGKETDAFAGGGDSLVTRMSGSQIIGASDRTPFTGPRTPTEVKLMVKGLKNVDKDTFRKLLKGNHVISAC